jgi:hypothetical protein
MNNKMVYGLAFGLFFLSGCSSINLLEKKVSKNTAVNPTSNVVSSTINVEVPINSSTEEVTSSTESIAIKTCPIINVDFDSSTGRVPSTTIPLTVNWNIKKIDSLHLFPESGVDGKVSSNHYDNSTKYYEAGALKYNGQSAELIFVSANADGPDLNDHYFFVKQNDKLILLLNESEKLINGNYPISNYLGDGLDRCKFTVDSLSTIPSSHPLEIINLGGRRVLELKRIIDVNDYQPAFIPYFQDPVLGEIHFSTQTAAYYIKFGPIIGIYSPKIDFYDKDGLIPQITFTNGSINTKEYDYTRRGGCGFVEFEAVVPKGQIDIEKDLVQVGTNNHNDPIYALKNTVSDKLKGIYEYNYFVPEGKEKMPYDQFIALKPLLYWVDPFGNLVALQQSRFTYSQAECGKPVIYLYPKETTAATVWLHPEGGFTYTEPTYQDNWYVKAEPNGQLTDLRSGKVYPYLFWEGRGGFYEKPKQGWVVERKNLKNFLASKLLQLGLNEKESADFMEFWLPRMQEKPYYFVTFMGNKTMDRLAPLTIDPRPDTVIRILMDYTALDQPIEVQDFPIITPKRQGFTIVEWGGVLQ